MKEVKIFNFQQIPTKLLHLQKIKDDVIYLATLPSTILTYAAYLLKSVSSSDQ